MMPDSITIKGQTYRVGDVLENYEQAAKLMDAWLDRIPYEKVRSQKEMVWFKDKFNKEWAYINIGIYDFPITILALPPQKKPESVDWLELIKKNQSIFWQDPLSGEVDCMTYAGFGRVCYTFAVCLEIKGVKFYATEEDCRLAEGLDE